MFIAMINLGERMIKENKKNLIYISILSIIIGISFSIKKYIKQELYINSFNIIKLLLFTLLFIIISFIIISTLLYLIEKIKIKKGLFEQKKLIIISFLMIFLSGLLFLIVHYPGVGFYDSFAIIDHPIAMATQHPIIYNLIISITFRVFMHIFNNVNISYFFLSLTQLLFCSLILTYIIYWFNKTIKNKVFTSIIIGYFSLLPIISNYNIAIIKDTLFGIVFLFYIPLLYKLIKTKGKILKNIKYLISLSIILIATTLLRNNGLYVVIFTSIIITIMYRKYYKQTISTLLIVCILSCIPNLLIKNKSLFQEKVGIPIQQIAYVVKYNENSINKNNKDYLEKIMRFDLIKEKYEYYNVDSIKWDNNFNRDYLDKTKSKFINTWFNIMTNNFDNYVKSYILMTYNLFTIDNYNPVQSRFLELDIEGYRNRSERFNDLNNSNILPNSINNSLIKFYDHTTIYINNGLLFFILLFMSLYSIIKKKKELIILFIPLIGVYLTLLISAPLSFALRYMSSFLYCLPIISLLIINEIKIKTKKDKH